MADLPIIFISAYGRDETIARALERGAVDYVVKPFSATELTARVSAALRRRTGMEPFVLGDLTIQLRAARGDRSQLPRAVDRHRIRIAPYPLSERGTGSDVRLADSSIMERT